MKINYSLILRIFFLSTISFCFISSMIDSVYADTRCKVRLFRGGWTEGCPHLHGNRDGFVGRNRRLPNVRLEDYKIYHNDVLIDNNPETIEVISGTTGVFQLHNSGAIWKWNGRPCDGSSCPHWTLIDNNPSTVDIYSYDGNKLRQLHNSGQEWEWLGEPCVANSCSSWRAL